MQITNKTADPLWRGQEGKRLEAMYQIERKLLAVGYRRIAGVDEVGRGPLAGPVVAAAAIIPPGTFIAKLNDSKKHGTATGSSLWADRGTKNSLWFRTSLCAGDRSYEYFKGFTARYDTGGA